MADTRGVSAGGWSDGSGCWVGGLMADARGVSAGGWMDGWWWVGGGWREERGSLHRRGTGEANERQPARRTARGEVRSVVV
jgi:hypothetical protein